MKKLNYVDPDAALEILGKSVLGVPTTHIIEVLDNFLTAHSLQNAMAKLKLKRTELG